RLSRRRANRACDRWGTRSPRRKKLQTNHCETAANCRILLSLTVRGPRRNLRGGVIVLLVAQGVVIKFRIGEGGVMKHAVRFVQPDDAQDLIEYALLGGIITAALAATILTLQSRVDTMFDNLLSILGG